MTFIVDENTQVPRDYYLCLYPGSENLYCSMVGYTILYLETSVSNSLVDYSSQE